MTSQKAMEVGEDMVLEGDSIESDLEERMSSSVATLEHDHRDDKPDGTGRDPAIAEAESKAVFWIRLVVFAVLVLSMTGVALTVYFLTSGSEDDAFESHFKDSAEKVFSSIGSTLDLTLGVADSCSVDMVSFARYVNMTWPFVVIPDFAVRSSKLRSVSKAVQIGWSPLVSTELKDQWQNFSVLNDAWVNESIKIQEDDKSFDGPIIFNWTGSSVLYYNDPVDHPGPYLPTWQSAPVVPIYSPYNWDILSSYISRKALDVLLSSKNVVIQESNNLPDPNDPEWVQKDADTSDWVKDFITDSEDPTEPFTEIYYPMISNAADAVGAFESESTSTIVGVISITIFWRDLLKNILPGDRGSSLVAVIGNECNQTFTYQVNGRDYIFLGPGDKHNPTFDGMTSFSYLADLQNFADEVRSYSGAALSADFCPHWIRLYPSENMYHEYKTKNPVTFTVVAIFIFLFTSLVFLVYDYLVEKRQQKVMKTAVHSAAIVSSLFPSNVRDRLFPSDEGKNSEKRTKASRLNSPSSKLSWILNHDQDGNNNMHIHDRTSAPIADFFPDCTVLFADVSGFTAWSSSREPAQVFVLLETIYGAFDEIARKRGVFKVETIGDSYVAVSGLPHPNPSHALTMVKMAHECRETMAQLTHQLESTLGPDTAELEMRFGLHSGPVTAGVLRGERSRFQLFGDTVNTASRMESTGMRSRIHVSKATADLLIKASKAHWVKKRDELIEAKGKGKLQTFWVEPVSVAASDSTGSRPPEAAVKNALTPLISTGESKTKRLVDWNVDILARYLRRIVQHRNSGVKTDTQSPPHFKWSVKSGIPLDEQTAVLEFPDVEVEASAAASPGLSNAVELTDVVMVQLRSFVTAVASMYSLSNPFHNFEHALHVTMSVVKLLSRTAGSSDTQGSVQGDDQLNKHVATIGVAIDPLTQFACVFAALIHDLDHPGVPNAQLVQEDVAMAQVYKKQSIAEQNSIDLAWALLVGSNEADTSTNYDALRTAICATPAELKRFRQLVVNLVLATDIADKELNLQRNSRWNDAFNIPDRLKNGPSTSPSQQISRSTQEEKSTLVLEHLMQVSDVSHTMQHWQVFRKWNERLFAELYKAHCIGRASKSPADFWYQGELDFFDYYIIPLAQKIGDSGAFGATGAEYLTYAQRNRQEWADRGREIVLEMVAKMR